MTEKDTEEIIDDLKAGREPKAGPRYVVAYTFFFKIFPAETTKVILCDIETGALLVNLVMVLHR